MSEEKKGEEDKRGAKEKVTDGIKQGIGVLSAFKEALEETIQEAKERARRRDHGGRRPTVELADLGDPAGGGARARHGPLSLPAHGESAHRVGGDVTRHCRRRGGPDAAAGGDQQG